jgi:hypothetical protein
MKNLEPPKGWGNDQITKFLDAAQANSFATFEQLADEFKRVREINDLFSSTLKLLEKTDHPFEVLFFFKAHSAFMGAVRLEVATQVPETFAVLKVALESSLYGLFIYKDSNYPELAEIWLKRHDSPEAIRNVKKKFQIGNMWPVLNNLDPKLHEKVKYLYSRAIDYGAHPNERSLISALKQTSKGESIQLDFQYLTKDTTFIGLGLKSSAQVGLLCLKMLELIFQKRFEIAGLSEKLKEAGNIKTRSGAL